MKCHFRGTTIYYWRTASLLRSVRWNQQKLHKQGLYYNYQEILDEWLSERILKKVLEDEVK